MKKERLLLVLGAVIVLAVGVLSVAQAVALDLFWWLRR